MLTTATNFLRDPLWATILGVAALAVALWPRRPTKGRALAWDVVAETPLHYLASELSDVSLPPNPASQLRLIIIRIWNAGDASIPPSAIYEPIVLRFADAHVLSVECANKRWQDTSVNSTIDSGTATTITIEKTLLNPKRSITLTVVLWQEEGDTTVTVDAAIDGVSRITRGIAHKPRLFRDVSIAVFMSLLCLAFILHDPASALRASPSRLLSLLYAGGLALPVICLHLASVWKYDYRPMRRAAIRSVLYVIFVFALLFILEWTATPG